MKRLSAKHYAEVLSAVWSKAPAAQHGLLLQAFVELLREQRALKLTPRILDHLQKLEDTTAGVKRVHVTAADTVDAKQLSQELSAKLGPVAVDVTVNPKLIAGLSIQIGDELIDATVATQLQRLHHHLLSTL